MGYLHLVLALLSGQLKGFCGKKQSIYINSTRDAAKVNFLRMLCCIVVGCAIVLLGDGADALAFNAAGFSISALAGLGNAIIVICWILCVRRSAYVLLDVFATIGVIVPLTVCQILFDEIVRPIQWAGFALLLAAVTLMCSYSMRLKGQKMSTADFLLLLLYAIFNGVTDLSYKLFVNYCPDGSSAAFNAYTFVFAAIFLGIVFLTQKKNEEVPPCPLKKIWYYIVIMAVCLFLNGFFRTNAAAYLPAVQLYPLMQGGTLVLAMLMSAIFFGEKITRRSVGAIAMTFAALLMINIL